MVYKVFIALGIIATLSGLGLIYLGSYFLGVCNSTLGISIMVRHCKKLQAGAVKELNDL